MRTRAFFIPTREKCSPSVKSSLSLNTPSPIDKVFSEDITTEEIFENEGKKLVLSAMEGFNVTIFTYGQTASGKTFTMRGGSDTEQPGIIPLSLKEIFHDLYSNHG